MEISMYKMPSAKVLQLLFIIGLINIAGGLILPLVGPLFLDAKFGILPGAVSLEKRYYMYGVALALFSIGLCFSELYWGNLSDELGRKRALTYALLGSAFGYLGCGLSILLQNLSIFMLSRLILGLMAGSQTIAIAAIIDQSTTKTKAIYLSWVGLATCLGLMSGPFLVGVILPSPQTMTTFHYAIPFFIMVVILGINLISLQFFHELKSSSSETTEHLLEAIINQFRRHEVLRWTALAYLLFGFSWFLYYQYMSLYLTQHLHYSPHEISIYMVIMVIIYFLSLWLIYPQLLKVVKWPQLVLGALIIMAVCIGLIGLLKTAWAIWLLSIPFVAANATAFITWMALFSEQTDSHAKGLAIGINGFLYAIAWLLSASLIGFLSVMGPEIVFYVACICALSSTTVLWYMKRKFF